MQDFLSSIRISYNCEWPVEIIIDNGTILRRYNRVFRLLMHVKYARFLMEKRDYHLREINLLRMTSSYTFAKANYSSEIEEMGV